MESGGQFERELPPTNVFYEELETSVEAESNANVECESASSMLQTLKRWRDSQPEEDRRLFDLRFRSGTMYIRDAHWIGLGVIITSRLDLPIVKEDMKRPLMTVSYMYCSRRTIGMYGAFLQ